MLKLPSFARRRIVAPAPEPADFEASPPSRQSDSAAVQEDQHEAVGAFDDLIAHHKTHFLCPGDLTVTPLQRKNVLLIGQCFFNDWKSVEIAKQLSVDSKLFVLTNLSDIPDSLVEGPSAFDFQILQIPMAAVIRLAYLEIAANDAAGFERQFKQSQDLVEIFMTVMMKFNKLYGLETYVCNFITPQAGLHGRFAPRYDLFGSRQEIFAR